MELLGVIKGLTYVLEKGHTEVVVHSDSAYVVNAINKGWLEAWKKANWTKRDGSYVKNMELWQELDELMSVMSVSFVKVKGHDGIMYNEIADRYAKEEVRKLTQA